MDIREKLDLLGQAAQFDDCASSLSSLSVSFVQPLAETLKRPQKPNFYK